jgi:hypothetical protein
VAILPIKSMKFTWMAGLRLRGLEIPVNGRILLRAYRDQVESLGRVNMRDKIRDRALRVNARAREML